MATSRSSSSPFFLSLSLSSLLFLLRREKRARFIVSTKETSQRTECLRVIESFHGSYSLRCILPWSLSFFRAWWIYPEVEILHMNMKKRPVSLYSVNRSAVLFRIMSLLINIASFENRFLLSLFARNPRGTTRIKVLKAFYDSSVNWNLPLFVESRRFILRITLLFT